MALDREQLKANVAEALRRYTGRDDPVPRVTQADMARRLDDRMRAAGTGSVTIRTYQRWEGAEVLPGWDALEAIADEVGMTVGGILGYDADGDDPTPAAPSGRDAELRRLSRRVEDLAGAFEALRRDLADRVPDEREQSRAPLRRRPRSAP